MCHMPCREVLAISVISQYRSTPGGLVYGLSTLVFAGKAILMWPACSQQVGDVLQELINNNNFEKSN